MRKGERWMSRINAVTGIAMSTDFINGKFITILGGLKSENSKAYGN